VGHAATNVGAVSKGTQQRRVYGPWVRGPELQGRDVEILRWIARNGVATPSLIARRFFWRPERGTYGLRAARHRLGALSRLGLILRDHNPYSAEDLQGKREQLIRVSHDGARVADVGLEPAPLVISELRHTLALTKLCGTLLVNNPTADLITEREIRAEINRAFRAGERESSPARIPDALLRITTGEDEKEHTVVIAVELALSRKDARKMEQMLRAYDREAIDRLWWFVAPHRVARIREFVRSMHRENRVQVFKWPE
jgi:hypothetical protein